MGPSRTLACRPHDNVNRMDVLEQFRARYSFPLDDFQVQACRAIEAGQSVIVSAPTGAGKTLIAEFAIHQALASGKRIAYTTPLKALSNQKFADFTRAWGEERVGILTGDVKVKEIADWISIVHRPIVAIYHPERPVPLSFAIADLAAEIHDYRAVRE